MKRFIVLTGVVLISASSFAQKYITAGGIRLSNQGLGVTLQQRVTELTTIEGIAMVNFNEYSAAALFEQHHKILYQKRLNIYMGLGPQIGSYYRDSSYFGLTGLLGLEYKSFLFPIVLSADIKPLFRLDQQNWFSVGFGFSIRYVLIKDKRTGLFARKK